MSKAANLKPEEPNYLVPNEARTSVLEKHQSMFAPWSSFLKPFSVGCRKTNKSSEWVPEESAWTDSAMYHWETGLLTMHRPALHCNVLYHHSLHCTVTCIKMHFLVKCCSAAWSRVCWSVDGDAVYSALMEGRYALCSVLMGVRSFMLTGFCLRTNASYNTNP